MKNSHPRILLTGASRGIGRATALQLGRRGAHVVLLARDGKTLCDVAAEVRALGGRAEVVRVDVTDDDSVNRGVAQVLAGGPIDVLVNNAGICHQGRFCRQGDFIALDAQQLDEEWQLNYFGSLRMIHAVLPAMLRRGSGRIINVTSILGISAAPTTANYSATKAALEAFSQGLRGEVAGAGVSVEVFVAPHTQTEMGRRVLMDGVVSLPVDYVASRLARAIERPHDRSYGSPVYRVLTALARWWPRMMERQMRRAATTAMLRTGSE
ncbi:MAG TPA: SDR family NAD(P)-dependent oxidoreductase [Pseudomonadales bacterium]